MGNCCSKELILDDERNINSLKIFYNKNIMKHIGLTPVDYFEGGTKVLPNPLLH